MIKTFLEKLKTKRKDGGMYYNYSEFIYTNNHTKGIIICPIHGEFLQTPLHHLRNQGCPKCIGKNKTSEEIINLFKQIHQNTFDYSHVNFKTNNVCVEIICKIHGSFFQKPCNHLNGSGCPYCAKNKIPSTNEYLEKLKTKRTDKGEYYNYSKFIYINNRIPGIIICPIHGEFTQKPCHHLNNHNCPKCVGGITSNTNDYIKKAIKIHMDKYDYSLVNYKNNHTKIKIVCKKHGLFEQEPNSHLQGSGCPKCSKGIIASKLETEWLDFLEIPLNRLYGINNFIVDGFDSETNIIYEFLGDYWHGNPTIHKESNINKRNKKTFGELYNNTIKKFKKLKELGYNIKYIWEYDWNRFKNGLDSKPKICDYGFY